MTETLSLISVVVMALLLWREHRAHKRNIADMIQNRDEWAERYTQLAAEHLRWSDRDEKGRFVKREKGRAV